MIIHNIKTGRVARKAAALVLTMALLVSFASTGIVANAASTSTQASTTAGSPPSGDPPSDAPPGGSPPSGNPPDQMTSGAAIGGGTPPSGTPPTGVSPIGEPPAGGGGGGADTMTFDYSGTYTGALVADGVATSSDGETYAATEVDQNAALTQNGGTLTISKGTFTKSGDDTNGDNCNFYGLNSILLAVNSGSFAYLSDSSLSADSEGSNGIFATDEATVYANSDSIKTTAGNSRGLDATYGGTIIANLMDISTQGDHSASIATDRGGGAISVSNSTLATAGSGSPLLYSTGDIEVDNVTGTATGSQIAGMEGLNTILIYHSNLESTITGKTASDPMADGIIIYQSTSGDAESTTGESASFEAYDSTLKSAIADGSMFYLTNTSANIVLKDTVLDFDSDNANLLTAQGNDSNNWGTAGSNGAKVQFTGLGETLSGDIDVDSISSLNLFLLDATNYTGAINISENAVNTNVTDEPVTVNLDEDSTWVVTGDSTISNLNAKAGSSIVDDQGNTVTIIAGGDTVVKGTSDYTVTVTGTYATDFETGTGNALSTDYIDRADFDQYYGLDTTFGTNGMSELADDSTQKEEDDDSFLYGIAAIVILAIAGGGLAAIRVLRKKRMF